MKSAQPGKMLMMTFTLSLSSCEYYSAWAPSEITNTADKAQVGVCEDWILGRSVIPMVVIWHNQQPCHWSEMQNQNESKWYMIYDFIYIIIYILWSFNNDQKKGWFSLASGRWFDQGFNLLSLQGAFLATIKEIEYPKSQRFSLFLEVKVQLVTRSPKYPPCAMHHGEHGDCGNTVLLYSLWSQTEPSTKDALARSASKNSDMAVVLPQFSG